MKIVYYIEPWIEMNWPGFRFGSLNGYLNTEINALVSQGHDVLLVIGDGLELEAKQKGFNLSNYKYKTIRQKHLRKIHCDYYSASLSWYQSEYTQEQLQAMVSLIHDVLGEFVPDVIMTWESPIPFMSAAYPNALVVYENYGAISRHPFPTTQAIDIFGLFKDSYLSRLKEGIEANKITIPDLTKKQAADLIKIRNKINKSLGFSNPFIDLALKDKGKKYIALVPLQVSGYYAFDGNVPHRSQFDYLCHILDEVSTDVLVVVTEHTSYPSIFTQRTLNYLKKRYNNFFWCEELNEIKGASQYLLPYVDFVIGTTSSVLLQAVLLDIPVKVIGNSHISIFSSPHGLHRAERIVTRYKKNNFDNILYHLLTKYWHIQEENIHNGVWLSRYLENALVHFRNKNLDIGFYLNSQVDETRKVKNILDGISLSAPIINGGKKLSSSDKCMLPKLKTPNSNYWQLIDSAQWVSFDIFDTLVQRVVRTPKDIFYYVGLELKDIIGVEPNEFSLLRGEVEKMVRDNSVYEEVNIDEIYLEVLKRLNLPSSLSQKLVEVEVAVEIKYSLPRKSGVELFSYAKKMGKPIFLISDMYLKKSHIIDLLNKHGIDVPINKIYVSSEVRLQKHSGNLFSRFISENGLKPEDGLHIGDNEIGDKKSAELNGIKSLLIPKAYDLFKKNKCFHKEITNKKSFSTSVYSGLLISKLYDNSLTSTDGVTCGDKHLLGYSVMGPLLVSFSQWLYKHCIENNIADVYFLSRDGKIFKKAFELLYPKGKIATNYLYASRRSFNFPSVTTKAQIEELMKAPFQPCSLAYLIQNRLGINIDILQPDILNSFNFERIVSRGDKDIFKFVDMAEDIILNNAKTERDALNLYLRSNIPSDIKIAIVDIGYKGSMQSSLSGFITNEIHGYYLVTMDEIGSLISDGFLENKVSKAGASPFWKGVALAEWLTLDGDTSVEKFIIDNGIAIPFFKKTQDHDISRQSITKAIHEGAFEFIKDWGHYSGQLDCIDLSSVKHNYYSLLATPSLTDIRTFEATQLEDSYGGRDERWLVGKLKECITYEELHNLNKLYSWKGAVSELQKIYQTNQTKKTAVVNNKLTRRPTMSFRKIKKLVDSPTRFFIDSRVGFFKFIGRKLQDFKVRYH
ncbi:hypothetical protein [Aeromonas jandaei]|uniref:hypothetical protein n=1 Tax=Aeromonas jandaei TaxID=650 RepID=UPI003BA1BD23